MTVSTPRLIAGLARTFRWGWLANVILWTAIWTMPVLVGLLTREFFDSLEGDIGFTVTTLVVLMVAYGLGRIMVMVLAMHNDVHLMFRVGSLLRRNMFARILNLPGAQATDAAPGELITRFREDVEHVEETTSWTVDMVGRLKGAAARGRFRLPARR